MRRQALFAPCVMSWQLTNVKRTLRSSVSAGAVNVRPMRLPCPSSSVKRYQYSVAGSSLTTRKRAVKSVAAVTVASARETIFSNRESAATSSVSR